ncbi:hypothetical protein BDF14DRAFT_1795002 [Spinellus fusiger]|nr:hypothetical protein BDF14DRAFT_1795002 [Spinellus fusiger]
MLFLLYERAIFVLLSSVVRCDNQECRKYNGHTKVNPASCDFVSNNKTKDIGVSSLETVQIGSYIHDWINALWHF